MRILFESSGAKYWRRVRPLVEPYGAKLRAGTWGLLFNPGAWWVGVHYSPGNKRYCINLLPCLTLYVTKKGGLIP